MVCHHNRHKCITNNAFHWVTASMGPSGTTSRSSSGQESPRPSSQCYLGPGYPRLDGLWDTWHLIWATTSASMLGWHQQTLFFRPMVIHPGMAIWQEIQTSECQDRTSECQMVHQYCPYPLIHQDTQIWKNLNKF